MLLIRYYSTDHLCFFHFPHRARKSRPTLQNKVRLKVHPEQLTLFVNTSVPFKNVSFNSFLLYRPDYSSEIHTLSYSSNEKYR